LKLRRYARFYLSDSWRRHYDRFPEVRIVTTHRPRVLRMVAEVTDAVRSFGPADVGALESGLDVTVAWESAFLARPSATVWTPMFRVDRLECLLPSPDVAGVA